MVSKFKFKRKFISMALALCLAASPVVGLSMQAFAGSGSNGMESAPLEPKVMKLDQTSKVDCTEYDVKSFFDFEEGKEVALENIGSEVMEKCYTNDELTQYEFKRPGIIHAQETVGSQKRDVYIVVDIDGILYNGQSDYTGSDTADGASNAASKAAADAAEAAEAASYAASYTDAYYAATYVADAAAYAAAYANGKKDSDVGIGDDKFDFYGAYAAAYAAEAAVAVDYYDGWAGSYESNVDGIVKGMVDGYKEKSDPQEKDWLVAAYAAVKAARKMADGNGLDPEAKLKIAHMAYRIAQFTWQYNTTDPGGEDKAAECRKRADALQKVIDNCYSDKVGDIEAQAAKI